MPDRAERVVKMTAHITEARTNGAKSGFNAYMATRVHTAAKRQAEIRSAGNKKQQFAAYCAIFGDQFGTVSGNGAVRSAEQVVEVQENGLIATLASKLGISAKKLAALVENDEDNADEHTTTERVIPAATRISWPMAMALKKIATKSGRTFEITDKSGVGRTADYTCKIAGRRLTPARASALIGESKASA